MPLSKREEEALAELEKQLFSSDPKLARTMSKTAAPKSAKNRRRLVLGGLIAVAGLAVLITGVAVQMIWLGMIGFLGILGGALYAVLAPQTPTVGSAMKVQRQASSKNGQSRFMTNLQQRWDARGR